MAGNRGVKDIQLEINTEAEKDQVPNTVFSLSQGKNHLLPHPYLWVHAGCNNIAFFISYHHCSCKTEAMAP